MATQQAGGPWWANMPLPPGWDAKYDQSAKKYFFVQHSSKSTQWTDPRKEYYESQQRGGYAPAPQHAPRMPQHAQRMPQHSPRMPQHSPRMPQHSPRMPQHSPRMPQHMQQRQGIPLQPIVKPKCKTCQRVEVPSNNQECQGCQLKARQREAELVRAREAEEAQRKKHENQQRIQKEQERRRVQSAARDRTPMQRDVQETAFGEETVEHREYTAAEKREMVNNLNDAFPGVGKTIVEMVLETSTWDANKATSVLSTMSPQKKAVAPKPKATTSSAAAPSVTSPTQPSDAVKKRMLNQLQTMHTSASSVLIEMALSTAKYDVGKASKLLRMSLDPPGKKAAPTKVVKPATTGPASTSGVSSARTDIQQPKRSTPEPSSSLTTPVSSTTPISSTTPRSSTVTVSSTSTARAPTVTIATSGPSPSWKPRQTKGVATERTKASPQQTAFVSKSTLAQGPDSSLLSGPNKDILLTAYVNENRSDKSLVHGPQKENVEGPSNPSGSDLSLASGPEDCICNGPQQSLAKGSMFAHNRQL